MLVYSSGFSSTRKKGSTSNKISFNPVEPVQSIKPNKSVSQTVKVKSFSQKQHRRGKRKCLKLLRKNFKWIGNNIAGASSTWGSLKRWVCLKKKPIHFVPSRYKIPSGRKTYA